MTLPLNPDPHQGQPVLFAGATLELAQAAVIMIHGRGSSPQGILPLADELVLSPKIAGAVTYLAPSAAGGTWYPYPFRTPTAQNEPYLSSALASISRLVGQIQSVGISSAHIMLVGFSQGACLALEWAARNARRFGGVAGLSGGVIGADGEPRQDRGSLNGTPVFLGCSDVDFHIPKQRVEWSAQVLQDLGGKVTIKLYPGMGHVINADEVQLLSRMVTNIVDNQEQSTRI